METKTVTIGEIEIEVSPVEGTLVDGDLVVSSINTDIKTDSYINLGNDVNWDDEEAIIEEIRSLWMSGQEWPDTTDRDWDNPRIVQPGTDVWETLETIVDNYPVSNSELDDLVGYSYSASSQTSDLKEMNLIACIGHEGRSQLLVPTHLGLKEVYEKNGLEGDTGLDSLFGNNNNKEESET